MTHTFPCGCQFPVVGPPPRDGALPLLDIDPDTINACPAVWSLLATGRTKGIFQLESALGRTWTKKLRPKRDEDMAGLTGVLRPGCLQVKFENGLSATENFCLRANNEVEWRPEFPVISDLLEKTYGILVFQEQACRIAERVADFDKVEQDELRKSIGKKNQELLARVGRKFIEKATAKGLLTQEQAEKLFGDIRKSGRYLFCQAHAQSYGLCGIDSAYIKAHVPVAFFASWLMHAKEKSDPKQETLELVADARAFGIPVEPPDIRDLCPAVSTDGVGVRFGLADVRGVGVRQVELLTDAVSAAGGSVSGWDWPRWLVHGLSAVYSTAAKGWIGVGALRGTGLSRTRLEKEYTTWASLSDRDREWVGPRLVQQGSLSAVLKAFAATPRKEGGPATAKRAEAVRDLALLLDSGASTDEDHPNTVAGLEEHLLGVALTCSRVEGCDRSMVNLTCRDFIKGKNPGLIVLGVELKGVRAIKTKKGDQMAFLSGDDGTDTLEDVCVFPSAYAQYKSLLYDGNCVLLEGKKDAKRGSLVVEKVYQLLDRPAGDGIHAD